MSDNPRQDKGIDAFKLNEEMAYQGRIGQKRKEFCINYIKKKREILEEFQADQIQTAAKNGEKITCHKGCTYCCQLYFQASVQECEAIVYYLYHDQTALSTFLENYTDWRQKLEQNGDIFKRCSQLWEEKTTPEASVETNQAFVEETKRYKMQNVPCPFLHNNLCLIYEVRPYTCAGMVTSTPPEWCNPLNPNKPKIYQTKASAAIDTSFYYKKISGVVLAFTPLVVYGILKDGYRLLSSIPGLEGLEKTVMRDPKVRAIMKRYL